MSTANAPSFSLAIPDNELHQMKGLAELLPGNNAETFARMMLGRGLGMTPAESIAQIDYVKGKAEISTNAQAARLRSYIGPWGERYDFAEVQLDDTVCILRFTRKWPDGRVEALGDSKFDMGDAEKAELTAPTKNGASSMYTKYARNMLFSRAMSNGVAWYAPETTFGVRVYSPGEMDPSRDHPVPELPAGAETAPARAAMPAPTPASAGALPAAPEVPESARQAAAHFEEHRKTQAVNRPAAPAEPAAAAPAQSAAPQAVPGDRPTTDDYVALRDTIIQRGLTDAQVDELLTSVGALAVDGEPGHARNKARLRTCNQSQVKSAISRAAFTDAAPAEAAPPVQDTIPGTATEEPVNQPAEGVTGP